MAVDGAFGSVTGNVLGNVVAGDAAASRAQKQQAERRSAQFPVRRALVAGVIGRLGEALLTELLARGGYDEVVALAEQALNLGVNKLSVSSLDNLPEIDDLFIVLGGDDFSRQPSFHGRDAPFVNVDSYNALKIAQRADARRVVLISSSSAWQQFGPLNQGLTSPLERELAALNCRRLLVLRPIHESKRAGMNLMQRFVNVYLSIQMLMVPRSVPTLTSEQLARAAVALLADQEVHGVGVFGAADLATALASKSASKASG